MIGNFLTFSFFVYKKTSWHRSETQNLKYSLDSLMTNIIFQTGSEDFESKHALAIAIFFWGGAGGKELMLQRLRHFRVFRACMEYYISHKAVWWILEILCFTYLSNCLFVNKKLKYWPIPKDAIDHFKTFCVFSY